MRYPLDTLHTPIDLSDNPDAKYSPFGENTTLFTQLVCPVKILICYPLNTFHIPIFLYDPDVKNSPFGENLTLFTQSECPVSVLIRSQLEILHRPIV